MATKFGKELRKIRLDNDEVLIDMAQKLDMSISYLSAIEAGDRDIPKDMIEKLRLKYTLSHEIVHCLENLMIEQAKNISIPLSVVGNNKKELVFALSRKLNDMSDDECEEILKIIKEDKKNENEG